MKQVVIMPGGFHPFHAGHYALYKQAQDAFPGADVYVAATNDTSARPFPFAVKEKLAKLAGVAPGHFVQVKSPFQAREITANLDPENTQLIFVRSDKDANKPPQAGGVKKDGNPAYLQPYTGNNVEPMNRHAYMAYLPTVEFGPGMTSATEIRNAWPTLNEKRKTALVMSLYPKTQTNPKLAATVVKMLDTAIGSEELNEFAPSPEFSGDDEGGKAPNYAYDDGMAKGFGLSDSMTMDRAMQINSWSGEHVPHFMAGFIEGRRAKIRMDKKQHGIVGKLMKDGSIKQQSMEEGIFGGIGGSAAGPMLARGGPGYAGLSGAKKLRHDAYVELQMVDSLKHTNHNGRYDAEIKKKLLQAQEYLAKAKEIEQGVAEGHDTPLKQNKYFYSGDSKSPGSRNYSNDAGDSYDLNAGGSWSHSKTGAKGKDSESLRQHIQNKGVAEASFDKEAFRRHMADLEAREELRKTDPVSAKALDLRDKLPQQSKKNPEDDSIGINDPRHPGYAYTQAGQHKLDEFAPDEGGGSRKFIPWPEFIEQVKQLTSKDFSCKENIVKSTIKARFVPHDPMEYGPTMLYSYYETRAGGRNKGAISTRGSIQVGKYTTGGLFGQPKNQLLTSFNLLKGHPFERHFDLTFDNIYKIANIIMGNTEGALQFNPEIAEEGSGPVEAYGYVYDRRDQRVMWRKTFPSAEAAHAWADSKNATVLGTRPVQQPVEEDYVDEKK